MPIKRSQVHADQIRYGVISFVIGGLLTLLMLANAENERRNGNQQFAQDSMMMLWSPAIFAIGGALFVGRGLLGDAGWKALQPTVRLRPRRSPSARGDGAGPRVAPPATPVGSDPPSSQKEPQPPERPGDPVDPGTASAQEEGDRSAEAPAPESSPPFDDRYRQACAELGVEPGTDWLVIRAIWRRKLQTWHPDQGGAHDTWLRKTAAYALLEAWEQFKA